MASWIGLSVSWHHDIANNHFQYKSYNMVFLGSSVHVLNSVVQANPEQVTNSVQALFDYPFTLFKLMHIRGIRRNNS
jgi:hypothetical protein